MSDESIEGTDQEMYSRDEPYDVNESESATPSVNPVGNQPSNTGRDNTKVFRMSAEALQKAVGSMPAITSTPATRRAPIKELRKYRAPEFLGSKGTYSITAENWLETTKKTLKQLECTPQESLKKYLGETYMEDRKQEFLMLKQRDLSVVDYEREFLRLSRYATKFVPIEADRCKRFLKGLRDEFQLQLMPLRITEFVDLVERAKMIEQVLGKSKKSKTVHSTEKRPGNTSSNQQFKRSRESRGGGRFSLRSERGDRSRKRQLLHRKECKRLTGGCFRCGSTDHFVKDCPKIGKVAPMVSQRSKSASRGRGSGQSGPVAKGGTRRTNENATQQSEVRAPAREYVVRTRDEGDAHDVVTDGKQIEVNGIRTSGSARIISAVKASKLLYQRRAALLAYVINSDSAESQCSKIRTVCEFPDVFPKKLPGLPLDREVEFAIEVYSGTDPVSIPLYRMSPTELKELKLKVKESDVSNAAFRTRKAATELRAMFPQLSIVDDGSILAELRVKPIMFDQIRTAQLKDQKLMKKRETIQNGTTDNFNIDEHDCLRYQNRLCIPNASELKELILREAHDSSFTLHPGGTKIYRDLWELYWWPDCITMDFVTGLPLSTSKKNAIWVIVDQLTMSTHFIAVRTDWSLQRLAETYIREIVRLHGILVSVISDRDPRFTSRF
ncbi:uncharacterized protein LOC108481268 [Gossypium arboreum]|uniref:uncharacterized protein LOC108481268 n=1 Tax=Gossypium arboreum TaxID=29729 RepID=UPI0008193B4B|nr:uncharacterized protein LOC108481268 [Gossypium arboreum]